mmetsp:Transcript_8254/g.18501  ORF Transcript_8254/g.18501 Transcript_8254/m.18501 type:complete len:83 (-) Transcript_8254:9-257(-)
MFDLRIDRARCLSSIMAPFNCFINESFDSRSFYPILICMYRQMQTFVLSVLLRGRSKKLAIDKYGDPLAMVIYNEIYGYYHC